MKESFLFMFIISNQIRKIFKIIFDYSMNLFHDLKLNLSHICDCKTVVFELLLIIALISNQKCHRFLHNFRLENKLVFLNRSFSIVNESFLFISKILNLVWWRFEIIFDYELNPGFLNKLFKWINHSCLFPCSQIKNGTDLIDFESEWIVLVQFLNFNYLKYAAGFT